MQAKANPTYLEAKAQHVAACKAAKRKAGKTGSSKPADAGQKPAKRGKGQQQLAGCQESEPVDGGDAEQSGADAEGRRDGSEQVLAVRHVRTRSERSAQAPMPEQHKQAAACGRKPAAPTRRCA